VQARLTVVAPVPLTVVGAETSVLLRHGETTPATVFVRIERAALPTGTVALMFRAEAALATGARVAVECPGAFFAPTERAL